MTARRSRGEGGMSWDRARQRWIASVTVGYTPAGKRIYRRASGRTKTEARRKLKQLSATTTTGRTDAPTGYTVAEAVTDWLELRAGRARPGHGGNAGASSPIGMSSPRSVRADWSSCPPKTSTAGSPRRLATLSSRTVQDLKSILRRAITRAQARDKVARNVVLLCETPTGQTGRPSKALTFEQAHALVEHAHGSTMGAYVLVSLLTGARTEELRALTWSHVDLTGSPDAKPPVPPHMPWCGARYEPAATPRPGRPAAPWRCRSAAWKPCTSSASGKAPSALAGSRWDDPASSSPPRVGTPLDAANVRRGFRRIAAAAGLNAAEWTPRELRHSFVSLLSDKGVPIEQIARLVGHTGGPRSPRPSTASNCARSSRRRRRDERAVSRGSR